MTFIQAFFLSNVFAFVPDTGQIARFQPQMRKIRRQAFLAKGLFNISGTKLPYELRWYGPRSYEVRVLNVPSSFVSMTGTATGTWKMLRNDDQCVILAGGSRFVCPPAKFWAELELMGDPVSAPASLVNAGFYDRNDAIYRETNSREPQPETASRRVTLEIGRNGLTPSAVLQIKGPAFRTKEDGEGLPLIQFDQSFLAPLLAKFEHDSSPVKLEATSDLHIRRRYPRFQPIVSKKLRYYKESTLRAELNRSVDEKTKSSEVGKMQFGSGLTSLENLRGGLSRNGENLLDFLVITH